jgi:hypothetical protein
MSCQKLDFEVEHLHELYVRAFGQKTPEFTYEISLRMCL